MDRGSRMGRYLKVAVLEHLEPVLAITAGLLFLSVAASKAVSAFGIPSLLVFLLIGMLAGSDGPGGIYFDNPGAAQALGVVALAFILFSGGMATDWKHVRPVLAPAISLASVGVGVTVGIVAFAVHQMMGFTWLEAVLLGSIVASTDAAAVFGLLRSRGIPLRSDLSALLELESGGNDPIAVFLTLGAIEAIQGTGSSPGIIALRFAAQLAIGFAVGAAFGRGGTWLMQKLGAEFDAMYHVVSIGLVIGSYSVAGLLLGNGFLAVYVAGITYGNAEFGQKRSLLRFHEGLAWLMQIAMFLVLGLQVFPHQLKGVIWPGLAVAAVLMLVARPAGVAIALLPFRFSGRATALIGWTGLRGAAPIVLATFPVLAGLPKAHDMFNIVFFVVILSAMFQGTTLAWLTQRLKLTEPDNSVAA